jgi:hypothetical protein
MMVVSEQTTVVIQKSDFWLVRHCLLFFILYLATVEIGKENTRDWSSSMVSPTGIEKQASA